MDGPVWSTGSTWRSDIGMSCVDIPVIDHSLAGCAPAEHSTVSARSDLDWQAGDGPKNAVWE